MIIPRPVLVREGIIDSERVCRLKLAEQLFFRNLLHVCDGAARFEANADDLRHVLYCRSFDKVKAHHVQDWLQELGRVGLVRLYTRSERGYGVILNYGQRDKKRQVRYPAPLGEPDSPSATGDPPDPHPPSVQNTETKRMEVKGKGHAMPPFPPILDFSLDALKARWPEVDVAAELAKALRKKQRDDGPNATVDLPWFEEHWLRKVGPTYRGKEVKAARIPDSPPEGWLLVAQELRPDDGIHRWEQCGPQTRAAVRGRLAGIKPAGAWPT